MICDDIRCSNEHILISEALPSRFTKINDDGRTAVKCNGASNYGGHRTCQSNTQNTSYPSWSSRPRGNHPFIMMAINNMMSCRYQRPSIIRRDFAIEYLARRGRAGIQPTSSTSSAESTSTVISSMKIRGRHTADDDIAGKSS